MKAVVPNRAERAGHLDAYDVLTFMIPCLLFVKIHAVGVLMGSDLALLFAFIYLALRGNLQVSSPTAKRFMVFGSLWLVSQIVTDIVRKSAFVDYARGWSNIGLTLVNFAVIYTLVYGRWRRIVLFGWGMVAGGLLAYIPLRNAPEGADAWKDIFSYPVTLAVLLIASRKECRGRWPIVLSALIGVVNFFLGERARGGFCLAAALYLLVARSLQKKYAGSSKLKFRTVALMAASLIAVVLGVTWVYGYAAGTGILGKDARTKYEIQSSGKYGVLLGGREELLGAIPAIYDSPILGHGSWARDPKYLILERHALAVMGYSNAGDYSRPDAASGIIQTHSYILGAWVDAGILGAVFWGWVGVMALKTLMRVYPTKFVLPPLVPWMAFELLWAILFSPYGVGARLAAPYFIVVLMGYASVAQLKSARAKTGKVTGLARRTLKTA